MHELCLLIGGEAGQGIESAGHMLGLSFARAGLNVFAMNEFCSQIRGGHNFHKVRVCGEEIYGHLDSVNMILALNEETIKEHIDEMYPGGVLIYGGEGEEKMGRDDVQYLAVPLKKIAAELKAPEIMRNTIGLGAVLGILNFDLEIFRGILEENFSRKGEAIVKMNQDALQAGYDYAKTNFKGKFELNLEPQKREQIFLNGNDAICLGALKAGCKFIAEYPMTPSSSILHLMAAYQGDYDLVVKHTEDEIAAVNMLTGAAYAGVRCMTGTSGGGFSLMSEAIGVSGVAELPIVIANIQRPGPSTGLPTRSEQGDLRQVMHASQGDFPRVVVAPADLEQCFYEAFNAFNLAEKYQLAVIILSDKYLGEANKTSPIFDTEGLKVDRGKLISEVNEEDFKRYALSDDGVSPRVLPGTPGGIHLATSYEHEQHGNHSEDPVNRTEQMDKRMKKMEGVLKDLDPPEIYGEEDSDVTLVTWGGSFEGCMSALKLLSQEGIKANILQIKYFLPFHSKEVSEILTKAKKKFSVEMNYTGQMARVIRENTGIAMDGEILDYSGRPFTGLRIANEVKKLISAK